MGADRHDDFAIAMDPSLFTHLGVSGITLGLMYFGMKWLAAQYAATQHQLNEQSKACQAREEKLQNRIQSLEDARNTESINVIVAATDALRSSAEATQSCAEALKANARAFELLTEESGEHRAHRNHGKSHA
jgi:hypothetical protein